MKNKKTISLPTPRLRVTEHHPLSGIILYPKFNEPVITFDLDQMFDPNLQPEYPDGQSTVYIIELNDLTQDSGVSISMPFYEFTNGETHWATLEITYHTRGATRTVQNELDNFIPMLEIKLSISTHTENGCVPVNPYVTKVQSINNPEEGLYKLTTKYSKKVGE